MSGKTTRNIGKLLGQLALVAGAIIISLPAVYMVSASLMTSQDLFAPRFHLFPTTIYWENYVEVFAKFNFSNYLKNSLFVTSTVVFLNLLFTPMVGYSLAKFDYPGKNVLLIFILATIMVPFTAILIPLFLIIRGLGWVNSYPALIVPFAMSAFGVFLMRKFILAVPDDYMDAGRIDGASGPHLFPNRTPADPAGADHPGHRRLRGQLGRVPVDAGGDDWRCAAHPPCRTGQVRGTVPHTLRADDGRLVDRRRARGAGLPGHAAAVLARHGRAVGNKMNSVLKPRRLQPGQTVGITAPAGCIEEDAVVWAAIETIRSLGFQVRPGATLFRRHGYFAGTDAERAANLKRCLPNPPSTASSPCAAAMAARACCLTWTMT